MRGFSKELVSKFIQLGHDFIEEVTYLNAGILKKNDAKKKNLPDYTKYKHRIFIFIRR